MLADSDTQREPRVRELKGPLPELSSNAAYASPSPHKLSQAYLTRAHRDGSRGYRSLVAGSCWFAFTGDPFEGHFVPSVGDVIHTSEVMVSST